MNIANFERVYLRFRTKPHIYRFKQPGRDCVWAVTCSMNASGMNPVAIGIALDFCQRLNHKEGYNDHHNQTETAHTPRQGLPWQVEVV